MACLWCVHFKRDENWFDQGETAKARGDTKLQRDLAFLSMAGVCRRDPAHLDVNGRHSCSSFLVSDQELMDRWWMYSHEAGEDLEKARAEQRRLKAVNQKLRERIRTLNSREGI